MAQRKNPFKRYRFPREIILMAVRWYCRFPLLCRDVRDILAERGVTVDASTIHRRMRKFGPEIRKRAYGAHRSWRGLQWHVDETYVRIGGRWCYLWRAVYQFGQLIDFRLTTKCNAKATRAFLRQARETVRQYHPLTIVTDKAHSYAKVIGEINDRLGPDGAIRHVDRKYLNNRIESDHAALKQRLRPMRGFRTLAGAKAALAGIETFRTIRKGGIRELRDRGYQ
ncbi:IS6 family transposase [Sulfitobacter porphyrae]|uniref:IS6 family transposase n=1 Tax=Sulfitobacter porphyrae TaxID=1246864 RepID=A0ABW2BAT9_9RHOB|nr:IS6 family transposase [Sulfitobacter porphyrae]